MKPKAKIIGAFNSTELPHRVANQLKMFNGTVFITLLFDGFFQPIIKILELYI
jgi:hypothetical protein